MVMVSDPVPFYLQSLTKVLVVNVRNAPMRIFAKISALCLIGGSLTLACAKSHQDSVSAAAPTPTTVSENGRAFVGMSVTSLDALPACDEAMLGRIVYVVSEKGFMICDGVASQDRQWRVAEVAVEKTWQKAFAIYSKYHSSVVRIMVECQDSSGSRSTVQGSGFHCAQGIICTNKHVLTCPDGSSITAINLHRITGNGDSITNTDMPPPFYSVLTKTTAEAQITGHLTRDLAKLKLVSDDPKVAAMPVMPFASKPFSETLKTLTYILSMSYPLGFTDLYTHLGQVNASTIGSCDPAISGGCPRGIVDFSTTNDTDFGSSGSPLLDLDGQVVGIVTSGTDGKNANYTWAIDASLLSAF